MKNKDHNIISIDAKKAFDKVQHPFMIKILSKVDIPQSLLWNGMLRGGALLNTIKTIYEKPTTNTILNRQKLRAFPLRSRVCAFTILIQHSIGSSTVIRQEKEIKGIQIGKGEVKLSLFAHDVIVYIEYPEDSTKNY